MVYSTVLDAVNYLWFTMASSRSSKDGSATFMDVIDNLGCQCNGVFCIETPVTSLSKLDKIVS